MTTLKGWISTTFLVTTLLLSTSATQAGIIVGNRPVETSSTSCKDETVKVDWGIIVGNVTGIIVGNFTGIIVGNVIDTTGKSCQTSFPD